MYRRIIATIIGLLVICLTTAHADCSFRVFGDNYKWGPKTLSIGKKSWNIGTRKGISITLGKRIVRASKRNFDIEEGKHEVGVEFKETQKLIKPDGKRKTLGKRTYYVETTALEKDVINYTFVCHVNAGNGRSYEIVQVESSDKLPDMFKAVVESFKVKGVK